MDRFYHRTDFRHKKQARNYHQKNHPRVERGVFLMRAKPLLLAGRVKRVSGTANRVTH